MDSKQPAIEVPNGHAGTSSAVVAQNALFFDCYDSAPQGDKDHFLALLVGRVYRDAPPVVRKRMIDHLLQPLGVLSLMAVANGAFFRVRLRPEFAGEPGGIAALQAVKSTDVVALVDFVLQVSSECVENLGSLLGPQVGVGAMVSFLVLLAVLKRRRASTPSATAPGLPAPEADDGTIAARRTDR